MPVPGDDRGAEVGLSLILPCYRGAEALGKRLPVLRRHLDGLGAPYEIVVVDDGSDDGGRTAAVASELGAKCVVFPKNRGKGAAVRAGMLAARGAFRIFTDVDVPYGTRAVETMLRCLEDGSCDVVVGDRTLEGSSYHARIPPLRRVASRVFSGVVGLLTAGGRYDTQCGVKGFTAAAAEDLFGVARIDRFAFDVELLFIAAGRRYRIRRVPVALETNEASTVRIVSDSLAMLRDVGRIWANQAAGRYRSRGETARSAR